MYLYNQVLRIHVHTFIPIHTSSIYVAMLCAFLLGFGDACFNTQVSDISFPSLTISTYYRNLIHDPLSSMYTHGPPKMCPD